MPLATGTRLGPYEVIAAIGAGGMGEVYRARDTRLDRSVAIKILHSHLSCSPELKSRFEREARTLSSLSHPHICSLYDVGTEAGAEFLVMEFLQGETLADRLRKGPLPVNAVLKLGMEVADALTKAHRLGVIHRDIKPSNIMLTANGAKLMDFGLAKPTMVNAGATRAPGISDLVTATLQSPVNPLSSVGVIVGTIPYMAPEQIEGKEADGRSDIFALGAVLYEALTGKRAFDGASHLSIASAILQKEPPSITTVQGVGSAPLDYVVRTCMAKDPDERYQTAHDVKLQLNWLSNSAGSQLTGVLEKKRFAGAWVALAAVILLLLGLAFFLRGGSPRSAAPTYGIARTNLALPPRQELASDDTQAVLLSPDGKHLAYVAAESGISHLYVRRLDQFDPVEVPNSEGPTFPFFSPNGDWIAFFSQGKLKKAPSDGGDPVLICDLPTFFGGTWTPQDVLVIAVPSSGLATVPATGGSPLPVSFAPSSTTKERIYPQGPVWLPGGDWIAFTDFLGSVRRLLAVKLSTGEVRVLRNNAQTPSYVAGQLVYYSGGALWAIPFDTKTLTTTGNATQIIAGVDEESYVAQASISGNGIVAYAPGKASTFYSRPLFFVNRHGDEQKIDAPPADYVDPAFSPDGKRIAVANRSVSGQQILVYDRGTGGLSGVVSNGAQNDAPVWTSDGKDLVFDSVGTLQTRGIFRVSADGNSAPQLLRENSVNSHVTSIAGGYAAIVVNDPVSSTDLWLLNLTDHEMHPFKQTAAAERQGSLSPDGHWIAYASNESGKSEVYVEPVPGPGGRWLISLGGGEQPRWARNGHEIFYRIGTKMMSAAVSTTPVFRGEKPVELFDKKFDRGGSVSGYDVSPDGQTFIMTRSEHVRPTEIRIILGWNADAPAQN